MRYLINNIEVEQNEFEDEFDAIIRAYFEEKFDIFLKENEKEIWFGDNCLEAYELFYMLSDENQEALYDDMFQDYIDAQYQDLEIYWEQSYVVGDVSYLFEIEE